MSPFPTTTEPTLEPKQDSQPEAKTPSRTSDNDGTKPDSKAQAKEDLKPDAKPKSGDDLKSIPMADLQKKLGSSPDGLSQGEAQKRLTQYGPNEIAEKKTNEFLKFLSYFWGPIPWMIEVAVILSGVVRHWMDFFIILLLLASNAIVGFWEEHQAGNAIAALKAKLAVNARVRRDGKWATPKASELVPGDVIRLRLGDIIPADARLLPGDPVEVDQSALTGESLPVTVKPGGAVFSGSILRQGEIDAMVYATGTNTYFGKTAQLVSCATRSRAGRPRRICRRTASGFLGRATKSTITRCSTPTPTTSAAFRSSSSILRPSSSRAAFTPNTLTGKTT